MASKGDEFDMAPITAQTKKPNVPKDPQARKAYMKALGNRLCDRNDNAYRRLSKS